MSKLWIILGLLIAACLITFAMTRNASAGSSPRSGVSDDGNKIKASLIDSAPLDISNGHIFFLGTLNVDGDGPADLSQKAKAIIKAIKEDPSISFEKNFEQFAVNSATHASSAVSALNEHDNFKWMDMRIFHYPTNSEKYLISIERVNGSLPTLLQPILISRGETARKSIEKRFPELQGVQFMESMRFLCERPWATIEQTKNDISPSIRGSKYYLWFGK